MTTQRFLEVFAFGSLCNLADLDARGVDGAFGRNADNEVEAAVDDAFGLDPAEEKREEDVGWEDRAFDDAQVGA